MDLRAENLVPLKTIARLRDGRQAIFINHESGGGLGCWLYRFCPTGNTGSFTTSPNGRQSYIDNPLDVMAIAKKRTLQPDDEVSITGLIVAHSVDLGDLGKDHVDWVNDFETTLRYKDQRRSTNGKEVWTFRSDHHEDNDWEWHVERKHIKFLRRPS